MLDKIASLKLESKDTKAIAAYFAAVMAALGKTGWRFDYDNAKKRCGACHYGTKTVTLSRHYVAMNDVSLVRNTILHEVAHVIAGHGAGHGPIWRTAARSLGIVPQRCNAKAVMPRGKWNAPCDCPGKVYSKHKQPAAGRRWYCRLCRKDLVWVRG